ncbi:pectinesterase family protein [Butyrivibrio sp. AE3006]|uniref:pectinesterase family protein n=1 Tax=Butyrivibrio sp. AE3006 TaxID=1280673 RepID=UPI0009DB984D|nr:pectinesterase family protein [Butyrivibrio sp. AE3006]
MMEKIRISVGPLGDYRTIGEAAEAVPYMASAVIDIAEGIYKEKLSIEKKDITLRGAGMNKTVISYDHCAEQLLEDNTKRGTFRSQTLFIGGERVKVQDLTVENTAGWGNGVGQALAIYADADEVVMEHVSIRSRQDTLFMAPLPLTERFKNGFFGPRMLTNRRNTRQFYKNCVICGDVDFIFGGADAVFDNCEIVVMNREKDINGYVTAPSENLGELGMVFRECHIHGENKDMEGTVFLGRPWRPTGKVAFIDCTYDNSIHPLRFSEWYEMETMESEAFFAEYNSRDEMGNEPDLSKRNIWVKLLSPEEASKIREAADSLVMSVRRQN